jgi:hypothetical protein
MKSDRESIICAAIHYPDILFSMIHGPVNIQSGAVFYAPRHHQIIETVSKTLNRRTLGEDIQGFITSKRRFVNRREAFDIAHKAGQIRGAMYDRSELYSEDLY